MRDNMNKVKVLALAMLVLPVFSSVALDMGGEWRVTGEGLEGVAKLPGTLGDAKLGKEQSYESWNAISNKQERYALRLQHQFIGEATWSRKVNIPSELACKPLELFLERVGVFVVRGVYAVFSYRVERIVH